jgi:hypothetical protein
MGRRILQSSTAKFEAVFGRKGIESRNILINVSHSTTSSGYGSRRISAVKVPPISHETYRSFLSQVGEERCGPLQIHGLRFRTAEEVNRPDKGQGFLEDHCFQ